MKLPVNNVFAVGGGKGGVGKSFFAANIACGLALSGREVVLVDADLAGANIHILFGIKYPERTLTDYLKKKVPVFSDILLPTALPNLRLICGASDILEIANPQYAQKQKLIAEISKLNADTIVIDIGAGANLNNLDFFNTADTGIIVTTPSPTSLQNAYSFFKMAVHRKIMGLFAGDTEIKKELATAFATIDTFKNMKQILELLERIDPPAVERVTSLLNESRYRLVVNMATENEGERVSKALAGVSYQFLDVHLASLGSINYDAGVENSIRKMEPILLGDASAISRTFMSLTRRLIDDRADSTPSAPSRQDRADEASVRPKMVSSSRVQLCLHDEALWRETKLHVQTEDLGLEKAQIVTLVFSGGQILCSRKTDYHESLGASDVQQVVSNMVKEQHRRTLNDIQSGLLDGALTGAKGA